MNTRAGTQAPVPHAFIPVAVGLLQSAGAAHAATIPVALVSRAVCERALGDAVREPKGKFPDDDITAVARELALAVWAAVQQPAAVLAGHFIVPENKMSSLSGREGAPAYVSSCSSGVLRPPPCISATAPPSSSTACTTTTLLSREKSSIAARGNLRLFVAREVKRRVAGKSTRVDVAAS